MQPSCLQTFQVRYGPCGCCNPKHPRLLPAACFLPPLPSQTRGKAGAARAAVAAAVAAQGYDSDEEVYATAAALGGGEGDEGAEYDADDNRVVSEKSLRQVRVRWAGADVHTRGSGWV
jgi:hypothetical protein